MEATDRLIGGNPQVYCRVMKKRLWPGKMKALQIVML